MNKTPSRRTVVLSAIIVAVLLAASGLLIYEFHFKANDGLTNAQKAVRSIVDIECNNSGGGSSVGTGFVIDHAGKKVITNAHLIVYMSSGQETVFDRIECRFYDSESTFELDVISYDRILDIAVLGFRGTVPNIPSLTLGDSDRLQYGQYVYTIGNGMGFGLSFTSGYISAPLVKILSPDNVERMVVQTNILINEGNSGGPLLTDDNQVVGMMAFRLKDNSGQTIIGMSFAIPSNVISEYLKNITYI